MNINNSEVFERVREDTEVFRAVRRLDIANQFRRVMKDKGLKNSDLAARLGVSEANVSRWLRGNQNLSLDTLHLLADALEESLQLYVGQSKTAQEHAAETVEWAAEASNEDWHAPMAAPCYTAPVISFAAYAKLRPQARTARSDYDPVSIAEFGIRVTSDELARVAG